MDSDLLIIFGFILLITIISGLVANGIVSQILAYKRDKEGIQKGASRNAALSSEIAERTAMIEDRLSVLERIATDRGALLADEIEALRIETGVEEKQA